MYAHANRYHLVEVERDWHFDPVPKLYFPKPPEDRRRTRESSIPRIYCEFCSANVTYIYVAHANKVWHVDVVFEGIEYSQALMLNPLMLDSN